MGRSKYDRTRHVGAGVPRDRLPCFDPPAEVPRHPSPLALDNDPPSLYAAGDACPECGKTMTFGGGEEMSRQSPMDPPCIFCTNCGMTYEVDWSRNAT